MMELLASSAFPPSLTSSSSISGTRLRDSCGFVNVMILSLSCQGSGIPFPEKQATIRHTAQKCFTGGISAKPASHRRLTPKRNIPGRNRGYLKGDLYDEKTYNSPMPFVRNMHGALVARPQEFTPARRWVRRPMWVDRRLIVGAPSPVGQGGVSHAKGPNAWDLVVRHLFHSRPAV